MYLDTKVPSLKAEFDYEFLMKDITKDITTYHLKIKKIQLLLFFHDCNIMRYFCIWSLVFILIFLFLKIFNFKSKIDQ